GLEVPETIEVGSLLDIRLSAADGMPELPILASVVRTAATPEARYRLGCNFLRQLTEQELATFAKSA
ncbi:MAG: PilZ domain-containing protein, partial [Planctomycetia bacterium]|nr:PilZ domain-containing protein [Planctomycetia bacterium]